MIEDEVRQEDGRREEGEETRGAMNAGQVVTGVGTLVDPAMAKLQGNCNGGGDDGDNSYESKD